MDLRTSSEVADWGLDGATHSPVPRIGWGYPLSGTKDWMGPPTLRYQGNVDGTFRRWRAFSLRRRVLGRRGSGHRAGWYIWSTDAAAAPSSVATAATACWATLRSTRPSEVKYGPM